MLKAIITTLDNLPILKEQIPILRGDPLVDGIVVVNNGAQDGTKEWLATQDNLTIINRENLGAGPGRNAGIEAALPFDYALFLDGGIRPLFGGTGRMLGYLDRHPEVDVVGVEIPDFETNYEKAWRRWPREIEDTQTYQNQQLSLTAYCLTRYHAWDGYRFLEEGPFGMPGWGVDDDEMACQWRAGGIVVHSVTKVHPYRHASGSFRRLYKETGIWPNQYGSVYEMRLVWMQQNWPQYGRGMQWGEPWLTIVIEAGEMEPTAALIKEAHNLMRQRRFAPPWSKIPNPYSVVLWMPRLIPTTKAWAQLHRLHQHHGDTIAIGDKILKRGSDNDSIWTGDFRLYEGVNWQDAVRPTAFYSALVRNRDELVQVKERYNKLYPPQEKNIPPTERGTLTIP